MSGFEVSEPILNSPFEEPAEHWRIVEGEEPQRVAGRRPSVYFYRGPGKGDGVSEGPGTQIELILVNRIRARVKAWREDTNEPYAGASRVSLELLQWWRREGRQHRLFYAQLEAAETIIFLTEARSDLRQGLDVPVDDVSEDRRAEGYQAFRRLACKMATGSGKTTVMGMLSAWSILNKVADSNNRAFSDVVLIVCPNVTIRSRLAELDPLQGDASLYRTRDLVPPHLMPDLARGRVIVTNWHVFEPQGVQAMGVGARVLKAGRPVVQKETIQIGTRTTTARGARWVTLEDLDRQIAAGLVRVLREERDEQGELVRVQVEATRYLESDASLLRRVLGRTVGGKRNILVMNDEAHHAYRIRRPEPDEDEEELLGDEDEAEEFYKEATVWVDGLDRIHKHRGINACLDFSATPYFLGRVGQDSNRPFPWIVSDFNLTDAIESGLVKIPQLAVRDSSGAPVPGYFNIWRWIVERLTTAEKGGKRGAVKPEAVLKWAHAPIAMLGGDWDETLREWQEHAKEARPPVFIVVCKNTKIAKVLYEWLAEDKAPFGIPSSKLLGFRNEAARVNTIRVDTKVVHETDTGQPKSDENAWMRFTLDTVGRREWPRDRQGREIYPEGFVELAEKLGRPLHPPGRDVRCIVSVGMLTEGWDCNTVTHIVGLRPFMSQLLCEQVVGRGLRRTNYEVGENGRLTEEVAKVLGVPFEIIPFKASKTTGPRPVVERKHVHAMPSRAEFEIRFPRVEGYRQAIRNRVRVNWEAVPNLFLDPTKIPDEVEMKAMLPANESRPTLLGPGKLESVTLNPFRQQVRLQELEFQLARDLCREYQKVQGDSPPAHVLFPQFAAITHRFLRDHVRPMGGADVRDAFLSPYYGWVLERLGQALSPDAAAGEIPELPRYEQNRPEGTTAEVDFWTSRDVREVRKSHLNFVVADTRRWEQQAAYFLDSHDGVECFVKNASLGFAIPYLENGQPHDFVPDFIVRLKPAKVGGAPTHLILETKGYDPRKDAKEAAARRWVAAVNADGRYGLWSFAMTDKPAEVPTILDRTR
jgi:type III restriction enzyme